MYIYTTATEKLFTCSIHDLISLAETLIDTDNV